jgi:hypothetical protein
MASRLTVMYGNYDSIFQVRLWAGNTKRDRACAWSRNDIAS